MTTAPDRRRFQAQAACPHPNGKTCNDCGIGMCGIAEHKECPACGAWLRYCLEAKGHPGPHRWLEGDASRVHVKCALRHTDPDHPGPHVWEDFDELPKRSVARKVTGTFDACMAQGHPAVTDGEQARFGVVYGPCYVGE